MSRAMEILTDLIDNAHYTEDIARKLHELEDEIDDLEKKVEEEKEKNSHLKDEDILAAKYGA